MPHNFLFIGLIRLILPEAKIIYCKRDPMDNCFSLYSHKFIDVSHQYSYNQKMLVEYYKLHQDIMGFWLKDYADDIFVLDNEELVNNQETVSKKLIDFCDLSWEKQCLEFHKNKIDLLVKTTHLTTNNEQPTHTNATVMVIQWAAKGSGC